ncbi:uncharacterized protein [Typha latifolia]|uniref:uncharacterized protein n=1 Tax=Typha latifolia TaxID=4733 RepID=UPI003C2CC61A
MVSYYEYLSTEGEKDEELLAGVNNLVRLKKGIREGMPEPGLVPDLDPPRQTAESVQAAVVVEIRERYLTWPTRRRRSRMMTIDGIREPRSRDSAAAAAAVVEVDATIAVPMDTSPPLDPVAAGEGKTTECEKRKRKSPSTPLQFNGGDGASTSGGSGASTSGASGVEEVPSCPAKRPRPAATGTKVVVMVPLVSQTQGLRPKSPRPKKKMRPLELQETVRSLEEEREALRKELERWRKIREALASENGELKSKLQQHAAPVVTSSTAPEANQQQPQVASLQVASSSPAHLHRGGFEFDLNLTPDEFGLIL